MNFLSQLTDHGLRRIYKFVLKRVLGQYLYDEFILEQLHVNSREGTIEINGLNFNPESINSQFLEGFPVQVGKLHVQKLTVFVSYLNILSESFKFVVDDVELDVDISSLEHPRKADNKHFKAKEPENLSDEYLETAIEGEKGLSFVAHWIESILTQLQVTVKNVKINLRNDAKELILQVQLRNIHFQNGSGSEAPKDVSSSQFAAKLMSDSKLKSRYLLRNKKKLDADDLVVMAYSEDGSLIPVLSCKQTITIHLTTEGRHHDRFNLVDIDIRFFAVHITLQKKSLNSILRLVASVSTSARAEGKLSKDRDLVPVVGSRFEKALEKVYSFEEEAPRELVAKSDGYVVDSDGEFPSDDLNGSRDDENFLSVPYIENSVTGSQSRYYSTIDGGKSRLPDQGSDLKIRLFLEYIMVEFIRDDQDTESSGLKLSFKECVGSLTFPSISSIEKETSAKSSFSIGEFAAMEAFGNQTMRRWESRKSEDNAIYLSPDISVEMRKGVKETKLLISFEPFDLLLDLPFLRHWIQWFSDFQLPVASPDSLSNTLEVEVKWTSGSVILQCLDLQESLEYHEFLSFWHLWLSWEKFDSPLVTSKLFRGGFLFESESVVISFLSSLSGIRVSTIADSLKAFLFCGAINTASHKALLVASTPSREKEFLTYSKSHSLDKHSASAIELVLDGLDVDLRKFEFQLATTIIKYLTQPSVVSGVEEPKARNSSNIFFQLRIGRSSILIDGREQYSLPNEDICSWDESVSAVSSLLKEIDPSPHQIGLSSLSSLLLSVSSALLLVEVGESETKIEVSAKSLLGIELDLLEDEAIAVARQLGSEVIERGRTFFSASSESGETVKVFTVLKNIPQGPIRNTYDIQMTIQQSVLQIWSTMNIWSEISDLLAPLTLQQSRDRYLLLLMNKLSSTTFENESAKSHSLSALVTYCNRIMKRTADLQSFESLALSIVLDQTSIYAFSTKGEEYYVLTSRRCRIQMNQLSEMKSLSLKASADNLEMKYYLNENVSPFQLTLDVLSVLTNLITFDTVKQLSEITLGRIFVQSTIIHLLKVINFCKGFGETVSKTFLAATNRKKVLSEVYLDQQDINPWQSLFREDEALIKDFPSGEVAYIEPAFTAAYPRLESDNETHDIANRSGPVWEADFGSEEGDETSIPVNKEFIIDRVETDSLLDVMSESVMDFDRLQLLNDQEIELQSRAFSTKSAVVEQVEPGLTEEELAEIDELDFVWKDKEDDVQGFGSEDYEQQANWFVDPDALEINHYYLHGLSSSSQQKFHLITAEVASLPSPEQGPEKKKEELELNLKDFKIELVNLQDLSPSAIKTATTRLVSKTTVFAKDALLTHRSCSRLKHYKVLGVWNNRNTHMPIHGGALLISFFQFADMSGNDQEYRMKVALGPLRCHLTEAFINFMKELSQTVASLECTNDQEEAPPPYFQSISVQGFDIKIDYHSSGVNLNALQSGDFMQLLNIFPLDGLELHLKSIKLNGVQGTMSVMNSLLEIWVTDIYKNQLHRVLTGTTPLKSIANIGSSLKKLLFIPLQDKKKKQVWKHVTKETKSVLSTVTTEALSLTHQASVLVANTIAEFASPSESRKVERCATQPKNVMEGLQKAASGLQSEIRGTVDHLVAVPLRQFERHGTSGVVKSVIRALPVAVLKPVAGVANGISYTVLGLRNSLNPSQVLEDEDLWESIQPE